MEYVEKFTSHPDFLDKLDLVLQKIKETAKLQREKYSDDLAYTGMVALAVHCEEKARRVFNHISGRKDCSKFEDELLDLLMYSVYIFTYWEMLSGDKKS